MKRSFPWNWAAWPLALVAGAGVMSVAPETPETMRTPPSVSQDFTTADSGVVLVSLAKASTGTLPPPDPRQRTPPCRTKLNEVELNGFCWIRIDATPPCPTEDGIRSYEHATRCYLYALRAARIPSAGGEVVPGIAEQVAP